MPSRWLELVPLDHLLAHPAPTNPKLHDAGGIRDSITRHGVVENPALDERTGLMVAGHGRIEDFADRRARGETPPDGVEVGEDGTWMVWTQRGWASRSDSDAAAYVVGSNQLTISGGMDGDLLASMFREHSDDPEWLVGTGYNQAEYDALLADHAAPPEPLTDPDDVPEPPAEPVSKRGDLWICGDHRVLVGDCRDVGDVERVLAGERINVAFTSPPYASQRDYDGSSGFLPIPPDEYAAWFDLVQANVGAHLASDGSWFVNIKAHCEGGQRVLYVNDLVAQHVRGWGWLFVDELVWTKGGTPGTWPNRFKNGWEPVFHFSKDGTIKFRPLAVGHSSDDVFHEGGRVSGTNRTGNVGWDGGDPVLVTGTALPSNVLAIHPSPATMRDAEHSAAFPVGLPAFFIKAYSDPGDVVFDPFGGSGSTLIAAHQEGRLCRTIEISPSYVDTICRRFQAFTGEKPVLESTGEPHDFLAEASLT